MQIFQPGWRTGSLAVLLTLVGACGQAHAQDSGAATSLRDRAQLTGDWHGARLGPEKRCPLYPQKQTLAKSLRLKQPIAVASASA